MDDEMEVIEEIKPQEKDSSSTALEIWGDTTCIFCKRNLLESKNDPKLLTCLHAACSECVQNKSSNESISCDGCSQTCQLNEIIEHQFVCELKQGANNSNENDSENITCSCADNEEVSSYCDDCQDWLCDQCVSAHQRVRFTKDHVIRKKEDKQNSDKEGQSLPGQTRYLQCPTHKQELLKLYCESCEKLTCRDCQLVEHKDHKYQFLSSISHQYKQFLTTLLTKIKEKSTYIESAQQLVKKRQSEILVREDEVTKEIKMFAVQIITLINQRGKQLLQELHETCEKKKEQLVAKNEELVNLSLKLEHCLKFADSAVKESSDSALVYSKKLITNQLRHVLHRRCEVPNPQHVVDIRFMYDNKYLPEYINKVGQIVVDQQSNSRNQANCRSNSANAQAGISYQPKPPPYTYSQQQNHIPNQSSPQRRPSPPVAQANYNPRTQVNQNSNHTPNNTVRGVPAQGFQSGMNKQYTPRNPQNMDPSKVRQQNNSNYISIRPRTGAYNQRGHQPNLSNQPHNSFQQHHDSSVRILNVQSLQSRNTRQSTPQVNNSYTPPKVISVTSMSTNQQPRPNSNISLSMTNTQRLSHFPSQASQGTDQSRNSAPRMPNPSLNRVSVPSQVKILELGKRNSDQSHGESSNPNINNKVPKSCSLTPVKNNKIDDDDEIKIIEEKRTGLPDINSKAAEALRELHAYVEQSIGNINEQTVRGRSKEPPEKISDTSVSKPTVPVSNNLISINEKKSNLPVTENDSLRDSGADSRSDAASRDSGIDDLKQTQEFDPNEDWCAVCHDGGNLLCCANCPRVYHYQCHVPAIVSTPSDDWACKMCKDIPKCSESAKNSKRKNGLMTAEIMSCQRILLELLCFENSSPFHMPVSEKITDYYKTIKNPTDFCKIRKKLSEDSYNSVTDFKDDIHLMFENCYTYNSPDSMIFKSGKKTENFFNKLLTRYHPELKYEFAKAKVPAADAINDLMPSTSEEIESLRKKRRKSWAEDLVKIRPEDQNPAKS